MSASESVRKRERERDRHALTPAPQLTDDRLKSEEGVVSLSHPGARRGAADARHRLPDTVKLLLNWSGKNYLLWVNRED